MSPLDYANALNKTYTDATDLYNRAVGMFGETSAQAAAAKNNMLASQRQLSNLSGAATGALPATGAVTTTPATGALTTTPATGASPTVTSGLSTATGPTMFDEATSTTRSLTPAAGGALSTATGASPSTAGGVTAAPATGALTTPATGAITSTPATGALTTSATGAATAAPLTIQQRLQAAAGADNNLTYSQLMSIANQNNLTLDQIAPYISDPTNRTAVLADLNKFKPSFNALSETYAPNAVNMYAINQAEELARENQRVDFSNQNRATQLEAWKRGLFNTSELLAGGTDAMRSYYGAKPVYLTSALTGSNQGATSNRLISTLQNAMQNPGGMGENIKAAVGAYQDPTGKTVASPTDIAAADAYVKRITGNPNATYANTLRDLDTRGGGFMYDEQRLLGDVKSNLTKGLEANLSISKWDPKTRGEMFAQQINKLKVTPSFVAAALGVSENDILRLAGGDPALWSRLAVNELIPTQPVREGASYRYGPAAIVSGPSTSTALTASQPTTSRSSTAITSSQPTDAGRILPRVDLSPQTGAGLVNPESVRVGTKVVYMESISGLPIPEQVRKLTELGVKASNLIASGFNTNYVNDLVSQGLQK